MTFIEHPDQAGNPDDPLCKIKVQADGRSFTVSLAADGSPVRVTERKLFMPGTPYACWHNAPYWHGQHHKIPKRKNSLIARIFAAAAEINEAAP